MSTFASGYIKYINHLEQINDAALKGPEGMIGQVEEAYRENLRNIARNLRELHSSARLVMLSGPSSSGKTTTARLLRDFLAKDGARAHIISLDDFYLGRGKAPRLPDGTFDYEAVEALNVEKVRECLKNAVTSDRVSVPQYDFLAGEPREEEQLIELGPADVIIVEGLHGLNPVFTRDLPEKSLVRLYVSVKQQIKDINGEVISPAEIRLARRIVRDIQFRGADADYTLSMWPQVEAGEDRYIRPYRLEADYTVNSIHIYEPCVLRRDAIPLLRQVPADSPNYRRARDLESHLMRFEPMDPDLVPEDSMLREFLGPKVKKM